MKRPLNYVALGDSLTEGYGVEEGQTFVQVYAGLIERRLKRVVNVVNAGVTGATSADIWERIKGDILLRQKLAHADLISLTAGGNDLLNVARKFIYERDPQVLRQALKQFSMNAASILSELKQMHVSSGKPYILRVLNLYNPFPAFPETGYWVAKFNKVWHDFADERVKIVDLHLAFQKRTDELIGEDMVHPNAAGYRLMAEAADACGYDGL